MDLGDVKNILKKMLRNPYNVIFDHFDKEHLIDNLTLKNAVKYG